MARRIDPQSMLVIARIGGSSSSRKEERCASVERGEALIKLWATEGYTTFWTEVGEEGLSKPFRLVDGERVDIK
ncbi:hypothetical protein [Streptomyces sp. NPDC056061]|uniref:hypothetical protein n=1 Tax=Streptomyces sp. NPDC056061 TaxID=3345700 RepID=UPI0035D659B1